MDAGRRTVPSPSRRHRLRRHGRGPGRTVHRPWLSGVSGRQEAVDRARTRGRPSPRGGGEPGGGGREGGHAHPGDSGAGELHGDRATGRIDVSNPDSADLEGTGHHSAAERIAEAFADSSVVKALNCVSARQVRAVARGGQPPTVPIAGDDREARRSITRLLRQSGFDTADAGPLANSRWIEGLSHLLRQLGHEEGLGDAVGFRLLRLAPAAPALSDVNEPERRRV
jgi:hypothetical protein